MGHASLVAEEGREVHWLALVILGEGLHPGTVAPAALLGVEGHRPMTGRAKLAVRLEEKLAFQNIMDVNLEANLFWSHTGTCSDNLDLGNVAKEPIM